MPLHFPSSELEDEHLGQTSLHFELCMVLVQLLRSIVGPRGTVGADQFVYYDAANPRRCLAPDAFVKHGVSQGRFPSWKTWERGAPDLAIEVLSASDATETWTLEEKIRRYRELGISELVVFDTDQPVGSQLRAWDRLDGDLVERLVECGRTPCLTLDLTFVVAPVEVVSAPGALRLARDAAGLDLVPTHEEARRAAEEARRASDEARRVAEEARRASDEARRVAEEATRSAHARIAELEAELRGRGP